MTTVALFGGSFNPPHVAHVMMAHYALLSCEVDQVWWLPTYRHVFGKDLASFDDRVAMCKLATTQFAGAVSVCEVERELALQPGFVASRTFDLLQELQRRFVGTQFRLLIGSDILAETAKWHRWDDVCALAPPIVIGRDAHAPPPQASVSEVTLPNISSTLVRNRLKNGLDSRWLIPSAVLSYIKQQGLYK